MVVIDDCRLLTCEEKLERERAESIVYEAKEASNRVAQTEKINVARDALNKIANWLVFADITSATDMAKSFPYMLNVCEQALLKLGEPS